MEIVDLVPLIELLDDNIDDLEEALEPLLKSALLDTAGKLPLLEKAQLYVLVTYTIESVLFSYLRLNGVNSKEHPVFRELTRVKQYFEKIKAAESVVTKQNVTLDKAAAGRFIKHSLAGNKDFDLNLGRESGKESGATHTRSEELPRKQISDCPENGPRAIPSSDDLDSDLDHSKGHHGQSSKGMKGNSLSSKIESGNWTNTGTRQYMKPPGMNGDSKVEQMKKQKKKQKKKSRKERKAREGSHGALD